MRVRDGVMSLLGAAVVVITANAHAQEMTTYTVVKGDTCPSVAMKVYGDARRIDLLHQANTLGPPPHNLHEGQILNILPLSGTISGPDATVGAVRNRVDVFAPAQRPAKIRDPLSRGNRVSTEEASAATIDFRDETRMYLGENTLVVILGDTSRAASRRSTAPEATLANGSLRTRLGELSGKPATPLKVQTDSATVTAGKGETQVSVDPTKTTRLAVYDGQSSITAQKKQVDVSQGFGSKAEKGKAPTPPRPLPPAPTWKNPPGRVAFVRDDRSLAASYENGVGAGKTAARWHVQLAKDAAFEDIVVDSKVAVEVTTLEARNLDNATYHVRVSAIDDDQFEGPWSAPATFSVVTLAVTRGASRHRSSFSVSSNEVTCSLDGADVTPGTTVELDTLASHVLRCALKNDAASNGEMQFASTSRGPMTAVVEPARRVADYEVLVRYQVVVAGAPIETSAYRANAPEEPGFALISDEVDPADASFRVARVRVPAATTFHLPLVVDDAEKVSGATTEVPVDAIPSPRVARPRAHELDVLAIAGVDVPTAKGGEGPTLGLETTWLTFVAPTTAVGVGLRGLVGAERLTGREPDRRFGASLGVPVSLRLVPQGSVVAPFVVAEPSYMLLRGTRQSDPPAATETEKKGVALSWRAGVSFELGPARVTGELGYRRMLSEELRSPAALTTSVGVGAAF